MTYRGLYMLPRVAWEENQLFIALAYNSSMWERWVFILVIVPHVIRGPFSIEITLAKVIRRF